MKLTGSGPITHAGLTACGDSWLALLAVDSQGGIGRRVEPFGQRVPDLRWHGAIAWRTITPAALPRCALDLEFARTAFLHHQLRWSVSISLDSPSSVRKIPMVGKFRS